MLVSRFSWFFAPALVGNVIALFMLPVTTYYLGPHEFGVYALMTPIAALGSSISLLGSSAVCSTHYQTCDLVERRRLVSTTLAVALAIAGAFVSVCAMLWPAAHSLGFGYQEVPFAGFALTLATVLLSVPFAIAVDVLTLEGRAAMFATITVAYSIAAALSTVVALAVWHAGLLALFIGPAVGAAVLAAGALVALGPFLQWDMSTRWVREMVMLGPASASANILEGLQPNVERNLLMRHVGLEALGLFAHSLNYRAVMHAAVKAGSRSVWPQMLDEARNGGSFGVSVTMWNLVFVLVTFAGVGAALIGRHIIGFLTHDRFTDAYVLVPCWMIFVLAQNMGKTHTALLYARGDVHRYLYVALGSFGVGFVCLFVFVPQFGLFGAVGAAIAQQIAIRLGIAHQVRRYSERRISDRWAVAGMFVILIALAIERIYQPGLVAELLCLGAFTVLLSVPMVQLTRKAQAGAGFPFKRATAQV